MHKADASFYRQAERNLESLIKFTNLHERRARDDEKPDVANINRLATVLRDTIHTTVNSHEETPRRRA